MLLHRGRWHLHWTLLTLGLHGTKSVMEPGAVGVQEVKRRVQAAVAVGALVVFGLASPASAAPPERLVTPVGEEDEADLEELFESACGVDVRVQGTGKVSTTTFEDRGGQVVRVQEVYSTRSVVTNVATGSTFTILDTGPDRVLFEDGEPVTLQQVGRSTTGSGTIGRTVFDIRGGRQQELSRSG